MVGAKKNVVKKNSTYIGIDGYDLHIFFNAIS